MQAIETKYLGPTNTKPSRIVASCQSKKRTYEYNHALNGEMNHAHAALALKNEMEWKGTYYEDMVGGQAPNGNYYWVFANDLRIGDNGVTPWHPKKGED